MNGLTFGRVFETEVRAHWTWILVLAFISVILGLDLSDGPAAAWPPALAWGSAITTAALVFASVTAHELAHVKVARRNGQLIPAAVVQCLLTFWTAIADTLPPAAPPGNAAVAPGRE